MRRGGASAWGEPKAAGAARCNDRNACTAHDRLRRRRARAWEVIRDPRVAGALTDDRCGDQKDLPERRLHACHGRDLRPSSTAVTMPRATRRPRGDASTAPKIDGTPCGERHPDDGARFLCRRPTGSTLPPPLSALQRCRPFALRPAFSPSIHDYAVLCDARHQQASRSGSPQHRERPSRWFAPFATVAGVVRRR